LIKNCKNKRRNLIGKVLTTPPHPASWKDINKFEKNNPTIYVNVLGYEYGIGVYPLRISDYVRETNVNLLLISNSETQHYCWIKNMSRLLSAQTTKHDGKRDFCLRCLNGFVSAESLAKHKEYCKKHPVARRDLPKPENATLQFNHLNYSMRDPFIVYADFEAFTKPVHTCQPNPEHSYTKQYQKHIPSSFCYHTKCFNYIIYQGKPVSYTANNENDDVAHIFLEELEKTYDVYGARSSKILLI